jgi:hypothetical protein
MIINLIDKNPLQYIMVDEVYSQEELKLIREELVQLLPHAITPKQLGTTAYNNIGELKKNCVSILLDDYYSKDRDKSNILRLNRKIYDPVLIKAGKSLNAYYGSLEKINYDTTLINYYGDNERYLPHADLTVLTAITTFSIGEFTGGHFELTEYNEVIDFKDNRMVIIPGCVYHQAKPIQCQDGSYRVSMAQFFLYAP